MDVITHNETVKIVMSWANKANKQLETTTKPGKEEVEDKRIKLTLHKVTM